MYTYIYTRPHKLLNFNSHRVKIKATYLLTCHIMQMAYFGVLPEIASHLILVGLHCNGNEESKPWKGLLMFHGFIFIACQLDDAIEIKRKSLKQSFM